MKNAKLIKLLNDLRNIAETRANENPPTDDSGGKYDAIWMPDLNDVIDNFIMELKD